MVHIVDIDMVDGQDSIPDMEPPASLGWRPRNDPPDRGSGSRDGRDYHKTESFVLASGDGHVVRVGFGGSTAAGVYKRDVKFIKT